MDIPVQRDAIVVTIDNDLFLKGTGKLGRQRDVKMEAVHGKSKVSGMSCYAEKLLVETERSCQVNNEDLSHHYLRECFSTRELKLNHLRSSLLQLKNFAGVTCPSRMLTCSHGLD